MLFNSIGFGVFFPIVFILYWFVINKSLKWQNVLLLVASYFFYSCWDYRFSFLLLFSTLLDFYTGIKIKDANQKLRKKIWLWISIFINLGFLAVFKYYNFFTSSFAEFLNGLGFKVHMGSINVILPVGISFYTFHGLSYVIDLYNNKIKPERNFVNYSVFVSFFPLLVAGPIERATHLLPQISKPRIFNYAKAADGMRQILWGLFKKIVIADNSAEIANQIFNNSEQYNGSTLLIGAFFFSIQIYCDFSGYSDIALGTARLLGIELLRNFAFPYFSRDIAEFWRRWHISLSSWFKDYLYIPLGGSKGNTLQRIKNTFIIFIVSGLWHGANWTFIVWGLLNAIFIMPSIIFEKNRDNIEIVAKGRILPSLKDIGAIIVTFSLTTFAWIFFRANNISHAIDIVTTIFSNSLLAMPSFMGKTKALILLCIIFFFFIIEWRGRESQFAISNFVLNWKRPIRWSFYILLIIVLLVFSGKEQEFIYFQF